MPVVTIFTSNEVGCEVMLVMVGSIGAAATAGVELSPV
jgi:hypothetical protein